MSDHRDEAVSRLLPAIGRLSRRLTAASAVGGFTPTQVSVLGLVARRGPLGLSELAALEGLNPTMLSRIVGKLDDAGLLRRTADPDDRRAARVEVTDDGARLAHDVRTTRTRLLARQLDQLDAVEFEALLAALPVLETLARELTPPGEPPFPAPGPDQDAPEKPAKVGGPALMLTRFKAATRVTFAALEVPNYRRYMSGQALSLIGTWMQTVAQSWLILQLTGSGADLGLIVALQTLPVLLLGPYGGVVADRVDKRKLMVVLQSMMGVLALILGILTVTGEVRVWQVCILALLLGLNNTFENPARQSFVLEMVGPATVRNAVSLNSVMVNAARAIGPALAGILIALGGIGICFLVNAASFIAVVISLLTLDRSALHPTPPSGRGKGQLREGIAYVRRTPDLLVPLLMMGLVGCLAYEFQVVLPLVADRTFGVGASGYGFMTAAMGVGAVAGGLWTAARGRTGMVPMVRSSTFFAIAIAAAAIAPNLPLELVALLAVGAASVTFLSKGNSTLQLASDPKMRGRVMALWAVAFLGSTPIGGPVAGWISEVGGPRAGLWLGAAACAAAALLGQLVVRRQARNARHLATETVTETEQTEQTATGPVGSGPATKSPVRLGA